ncbi:MAG: hypothetical protein JNK67_03120 [Alphaproteobacteria bacterium]|nr:hypothetical protein [Alphaproteobacteria bacterium]
MSLRRLLPVLALLGLSGCASEIALVGLIENNNYKTSGRSISGWALSALNDEDCEPMRTFERKPICRPRAEPVAAASYCYQTLAAVTCFDQPHPTMPKSRYLPPPGQSR